VKTHAGALLVPQRAVTELQGGYQVAVVGEGNKINIRPVTVGERIGSMWIVDGVKPGETVVVEGLTKIKDGSPVNPKPMTSSANPSKTGA
jgi:membrane fusion protein (multidrug efflux system)